MEIELKKDFVPLNILVILHISHCKYVYIIKWNVTCNTTNV